MFCNVIFNEGDEVNTSIESEDPVQLISGKLI